MKARLGIFIFAGFVSSVGVAEAHDYTPMKIIQSEPVYYPRDVLALGLIEGAAQVAIQIDEKGRLTDYLVLGYTHKSFADAAVAGLKLWHFEPAWLDGEPHSATSNLTFSFESKGLVVVDMTITNTLELQKLWRRPDYYGSWACTLSQLDRIPTPTKVVTPRYPFDAADKAKEVVVSVHFYIDQTGTVRLPAVTRETSEANDAFAGEALAAISQWQFEPPLSRGRKVLVSAVQDFHFHPVP